MTKRDMLDLSNDEGGGRGSNDKGGGRGKGKESKAKQSKAKQMGLATTNVTKKRMRLKVSAPVTTPCDCHAGAEAHNGRTCFHTHAHTCRRMRCASASRPLPRRRLNQCGNMNAREARVKQRALGRHRWLGALHFACPP